MIVLIGVYIVVTLRLLRRKASLLWVPALVILLCAVCFYWMAYGNAGVETAFSRFILSATAALQLFVFKIETSPSNFFYVKDGMSLAQASAAATHLTILHGLFICAVWTTSILIASFFAKRFVSRVWLWVHRPGTRGVHLFLGTDRYATTLAADIFAKGSRKQMLFVDFPPRESIPVKVSVWELVKGIKMQSTEVALIKQQIPSAVVLSATHNPKDCPGKSLFQELGLGRLAKWVENEQTNIYIFSEDLDENISLLQKLKPSDAHIYVRAPRYGLNRRLELSTNRKVQLIDQSFLTARHMKMDDSLQPVHYVKRGLDAFGQPLGWVENPLNAMLLGFGYVGRGALSFLYEFGTFVGKDKQELPLRCEVIDCKADALGDDFQLTHPGVPQGRIVFSKMDVGSKAFWEHIAGQIHDLNYIVIALGDDNTNVRIGLDVLELMSRNGLSKTICLVIRLEEPEKYLHLIKDFQDSLGAECIHLIGGLKETWTKDNIMDESFEPFAKAYYMAYSKASCEALTWEERLALVNQKETFPVWKKNKLRRLINQDYTCLLHEKVKRSLMPARFLTDDAVAESIPPVYNGKHSDADPDTAAILDYLAIGEHLRWKASLQMEGYSWGQERRDDWKTHPLLVPFNELSETEKHYNYLTVKTSMHK